MYINRIDISLIYRPFLNKLVELLVNCAVAGQRYVITSGTRTYQEQNELYAQGRTKPGKIVTNAKGGQSYHNFGIAADFVPDMSDAPGLQPSWDEKNFKILRDEAIKLGLESGLDWKFKDPPHIQLPLAKNNITLSVLDAEYAKGGYQAVFRLLDKYKW
jgi:peptidoglycan L-alanyl-D-glutamate endopeptidase CwlK